MSQSREWWPKGCQERSGLCNCSEIRGKCKEPRIKETPGSFRRHIEKRDRERSGGGKNECRNREHYTKTAESHLKNICKNLYS